MQKIKQALKNKNLDHLYFFHGEEAYLSEYYTNQVKKQLIEDESFNFIKLYADDISRFQESVEACPVFEEQKLVVVKGRDFTDEWKAEQLHFLAEMLDQIPSYTYLIFLCGKLKDKRSKIYKLLADKCTECVFDHQKPADVINWIGKAVKTRGMEIDRDTAAFLLEYTGVDMTNILSELEKVSAYEQEKGRITKDGIKAVVTKTVETKVFDLMDAVTDGKKARAFQILNDLKTEKEEPIYINGALMRNLKGILEYKILSKEGKSASYIADKMRLRPYTQKKYGIQARKFSEPFLEKMLSGCSAFDIGVKTGEMDGYTGLSILIGEMMI